MRRPVDRRAQIADRLSRVNVDVDDRTLDHVFALVPPALRARILKRMDEAKLRIVTDDWIDQNIDGG